LASRSFGSSFLTGTNKLCQNGFALGGNFLARVISSEDKTSTPQPSRTILFASITQRHHWQLRAEQLPPGSRTCNFTTAKLSTLLFESVYHLQGASAFVACGYVLQGYAATAHVDHLDPHFTAGFLIGKI
jgi:hypothetical protein